ncbi:hypothetical protein ACL02S_11325 [Nocardia sp. 004]|uniref:hypothetical protein n=1 Tax=Nocardia sp. 004 TaxID=3385978 RepID=UPI00399F90BF
MNACTTHAIARRLLAGIAIACALAISGTGLTSAEAHASNPRKGSGDTTGWHHIDPMGFHHRDRNQLDTREHDTAFREYHRRNNQSTPGNTATGDNSGNPIWKPVPRPDGNGYTVCRPHASWC